MIAESHNRINFADILAYICIALSAIVALDENWNSYALFIAIPTSFALCFLTYNTLSQNKYMRILLAIYLWLCVSYVFTDNIDAANDELRKILGCFILSYSVASLAQKPKAIPWLYIVYCLLLVYAWKYASEHIIDNIIFGSERLSDETLNANHLAYYTFYTTICVYILGEIVSIAWIRHLFRIVFFGTLILSFYTAIFTASRQILIIQVPLFAILIICRYMAQSRTSSIVRWLIIIVSIVAATYAYNHYYYDIYDNSLLQERSSNKIEDDDRMRIALEALDISVERPIFGYGPGNAMYNISTKHFTHNTFLELMVNGGIPCMLIFVYLVYTFLATQIRRWCKTRDKQYLTFFIFGIFWLIDQIFYVFYVDLWLISFFILVATHSDTYYKNSFNKLEQ